MDKIRKESVIIGLIVMLACGLFLGFGVHNKNVAKEQEKARIEYQEKFDNKFDKTIETCYSEFDEIEGVKTVEIIDMLSEIDYLVEENADKNIVLYQFGELFRLIGEKDLSQRNIFELYQLIINNYK